MHDPIKEAEMTKELRTARGYLLAVGIIMFVMDMVFIHLVFGKQMLESWRMGLTVVSACMLAAFVALYFFAKRQPTLCLVLGLVLFWSIQLVNMAIDPKSITQGIILKILFTMALVK